MTVIVRCVDPRLNGVFENLQREIKDYAVISNAGSIKFFLKEHIDDLVEQLNILINGFSASKLIITNHTDCGYYKGLGENSDEIYERDLLELKTKLHAVFGDKLEIVSGVVDTAKLTLQYL